MNHFFKRFFITSGFTSILRIHYGKFGVVLEILPFITDIYIS